MGCAHYVQGNGADYWRAIVTAAGGTGISSIEIDADNVENDDFFYSETKHLSISICQQYDLSLQKARGYYRQQEQTCCQKSDVSWL